MDFIVKLAMYIQSYGIGMFDESGVSGDIFIAVSPPTPDSCIVITPTGGGKSDMRMSYDNPSVQIQCRCNQSPMTAYNQMHLIYECLHGMGGVTIDGVYVVSCQALQSAPISLGMDENMRHHFAMNFLFEIKNDTTNRRPE